MLDFIPSSKSQFGLPPNVQKLTAESIDSILPHENSAGLAIRIINRTTGQATTRFRIGDEVQFQIDTAKAGELLLFDVNAKGELTQLFPNQNRQGQWVPQKGTVKIPNYGDFNSFVAAEPKGKSQLVALLSEDRVFNRNKAIIPLPPSNSDESFYSTEATQAVDYVLRIREHLNQIYHQADGHNRAIKWSVTTLDYVIE